MNLNEINSEMEDLKDWSIDANSIIKNFAFGNFKESLDFVNKVGEIAERLEHHPDVMINYNKVRLTLSTHSLRGLSRKDFDLAREIDKIGS